MSALTDTQIRDIARKVAAVDELEVLDVLCVIAASALDPSQNGNDTASVVYEQLARLGVVVP